jgi:hypothetical protein
VAAASRPPRTGVERNLGRIERVIEPASTLCPCGCGPMARIGGDRVERLDVIPARFRALATIRPKYACRRCAGAVAQPWKETTARAAARNQTFLALRRLGDATWRRWSGYHRRSRAETTMHCVKLLCLRLMARDFDRQVAALHVRVAVLNRFTALGIPVAEAI